MSPRGSSGASGTAVIDWDSGSRHGRFARSYRRGKVTLQSQYAARISSHPSSPETEANARSSCALAPSLHLPICRQHDRKSRASSPQFAPLLPFLAFFKAPLICAYTRSMRCPIGSGQSTYLVVRKSSLFRFRGGRRGALYRGAQSCVRYQLVEEQLLSKMAQGTALSSLMPQSAPRLPPPDMSRDSFLSAPSLVPCLALPWGGR